MERKAYEKLIKLKKHAFIQRQHSRLMRLRKSNPREYWMAINIAEGATRRDISIELQSMAEHFKKLNHSTEDNHSDHYVSAEILVEDDFLDSDICEEEVKSVKKQLKNPITPLVV